MIKGQIVETIDCCRFEDQVSDYLDQELDRPSRRAFAEHLLSCRACHSLFDDVRAALETLRGGDWDDLGPSGQIETRVVRATTAGEMLSCQTLDLLICDYFCQEEDATDPLSSNLPLVPRSALDVSSLQADDLPHRIFEAHFSVCDNCRHLVEGVRQSMERLEELEVPDQLYDRILAATVGGR
jgi:hypothetical protein